jgi:GT2 family glycosyltransferase/tetratricopeptide (TPR) repeat protein
MLCSILLVHDDSAYIFAALDSIRGAHPTFAFVSKVPWHGIPGDWQKAADVATEAGAEVILGEWHSEEEHRRAAQVQLLERGFTHALIPDGDEVIEPRLLQSLVHIAEAGLAERVYVEWDTYWKTPEYVIRPRERFTPLMLIDLRATHCVEKRHYEGGRGLFLSEEHGIVHHLSYVGPDERIQRKITTWGHADEVTDRWYENVWLAWDSNKLLGNLHPTSAPAYGFAERISVPSLLLPAMEQYRELSGLTTDLDLEAIDVPSPGLQVSVVIPLHGGEVDIAACLQSLANCRDLIHETIVVDNASPDNAAEIAKTFDGVIVLHSESNCGFSAACNRGWNTATGDVILFLNSDTVVPRAGLIRLIESLTASGSIAAAGPYTNRSGHLQQIDPTYTSIANLEGFAEDFALRPAEDVDCDMLVGFCLAIRRTVLQELGGFDERFGLGMFEDNDICYRIRRSGYRLVIAGRSFVHHEGSKTMGRMRLDASRQLERNLALYREKWTEDLESGFASNLSGLTGEPIVFEPAKHPDVRRRKMAEKAKRAGISLCMIVKNEERVLADALRSAEPFFAEIIVVDTGSTDRTREIAVAAGASVFDFPWTDSFSEARNESLKHASGRWIFWMDADDTLPWESGEALVDSVLTAARDVAAFVVPVQFVEDTDPSGKRIFGTRVDHVKLFRNIPGLEFEGRIHEQILPSLRAHGGHQIARCSAVVLHSGYDTSVAGQKKKRERDFHLLKLELRERGHHPFVLFNIGMTYHYIGEHVRAVRWLKRCLRYSPQTESHVRKAYVLLAVSLRELDRPDECIETLKLGLTAVGADPELSFQMGLTLAASGNWSDARTHYEAVLSSDTSDHFSSCDTGILSYKTFHNLAVACLAEGAYNDAKGWWEKAVESAPGFSPSAIDLFHAAVEHGDIATARHQLAYVALHHGQSVLWAELGATLAESVSGPDNATEFLRSAAMNSPHYGPHLVLARRLLTDGHIGEAVPILRQLERSNVAEAAYLLGIHSLNDGQSLQALDWMRRSLELNPGHSGTLQQIAQLEAALGIQRSEVPQMTMTAAVAQIADDLGLDADELTAFCEEDTLGGYSPGPMAPGQGRWPGGSVWSVEGKILYAVARTVKPKTLVEIGSAVGCSTSHLALACRRNGMGTVYAIDPSLDFSHVDPELQKHIVPIRQDAMTWTPPGTIDMVFEDGPHTPGFTQAILERLRPWLADGAVVLAHDACHALHGSHIREELRLTVPEGHGFVLIEPSDCGLGYGKVALTTSAWV